MLQGQQLSSTFGEYSTFRTYLLARSMEKGLYGLGKKFHLNAVLSCAYPPAMGICAIRKECKNYLWSSIRKKKRYHLIGLNQAV